VKFTASRLAAALLLAITTRLIVGCSGSVGTISLSPPTYWVGATVSGLVGSGLEISSAVGGYARGANGFVSQLVGPLVSGQTYNLSVSAQPTNPAQTCTVANASGTIANADVTNVQITCTTNASRYLFVATAGSIVQLAIDAASGALSPVATAAAPGGGPHSICVDFQSRFLYLTNAGANSVSVFQIASGSGALSAASGSPFATGLSPGSVSVHPSGPYAFVTNAGDGTFSMYDVDTQSGRLTPIAGSPFAAGFMPKAAAATYSTYFYEQFLYVASAGTTQGLFGFSIGGYPGTSMTTLSSLSSSPSASGSDSAAIFADPAGTRLYVADTNDNALLIYAIAAADGSLSSVPAPSGFSVGRGPAAILGDAQGRFVFVANSVDNTVSAYAIAPLTGVLSPAPGSPFASGSAPNALAVDNQGKYLYVANSASNNVSAFAIDQASGNLTPLPNSPYAVAAGPASLAVSN
jgi:6-phosphogluconolactonase